LAKHSIIYKKTVLFLSILKIASTQQQRLLQRIAGILWYKLVGLFPELHPTFKMTEYKLVVVGGGGVGKRYMSFHRMLR